MNVFKMWLSKYAILLLVGVIVVLLARITWDYVARAHMETKLAQEQKKTVELTGRVTEQSSAIRTANEATETMRIRYETLKLIVGDSVIQSEAIGRSNQTLLKRIASERIPTDCAGAAAWSKKQYPEILNGWQK